MHWILLSLLSAFSETLKDTFGKISSLKTNEYTSAITMHLVTFFCTFPFVIFTGIPKLQESYWLGTLAFLFITPTWSILYMKALKWSPLSVTLPMMAFNPVFTALLNLVFKGGAIDSSGWAGIIFISVGIYCVNLKLEHANRSILQPFSHILGDKGALAMLGVAALWSLGAHFSKMQVDGSTPLFTTFTSTLVGVTTIYIVAHMRKQTISWKDFYIHAKHLAPVGFFYYVATISSSFALGQGQAAYVFPIKRGSIIFSSLVGKVFFKEEFNWIKYVGLFLISLGIVLIAV